MGTVPFENKFMLRITGIYHKENYQVGSRTGRSQHLPHRAVTWHSSSATPSTPCWYRCSTMATCRTCCCFACESHTASEITWQISQSSAEDKGPVTHICHTCPPDEPHECQLQALPLLPRAPTRPPCQWLCPLGRHCCECPWGLKPVSAPCL